jgi:hypothetical protein
MGKINPKDNMDNFDLEDQPQTSPRRSGRMAGQVNPMVVKSTLWNILTGVALLGVVCVAGVCLLIFTNPFTSLNPFPPPTGLPPLIVPTATQTFLPPSWTPFNTPLPTITETPRPTATQIPSPTVFSLSELTPSPFPTDTPTATKPPAGYPFAVQKGSPVAIANIYHPDLACNWLGVGGQVVDMSGAPVTGLIIRLGGELPGVKIPEHMMSLTGVALSYGGAGYEFTIADKPIASKASLWIQLLDQAGIPISDQIYFNTYEGCEKNLIIINFKQVR